MKRFFQKKKKVFLATMMVAVILVSVIGPIGINHVNAQNVFSSGRSAQSDIKAAAQFSSPAEGSAGSKGSCGWVSFLTLQCILSVLTDILYYLILMPLSYIFRAVGSILDYFLKFSLDSTHYSNIDAISAGWTVIRDLMNMVFIFILLYSAICTILDVQQNYNVKKVLPRLIIAALFINFSLFVTKIVLDAGNIVAIEFYNRIVGSIPVPAGQSEPSLSAVLAAKLRMDRTFDSNTLTEVQRQNIVDLQSGRGIMNVLARIILLIVAIYVFFQLAFIFIGRTVGFFFLMLFSPIGFMGSVLPGIGKYSKQWQDALVKQTIVAPVFLIILYVIVKVIDGFSAKINFTLVDPNSMIAFNDISIYADFVVVIGLFILLMKVTQELAGELGAMASNFGKKVMGVAAGVGLAAATGGAALAARGTVGAFATGAASGSTFKERVSAGFKNVIKPVAEPYSRMRSNLSSKGLGGALKAGAIAGAIKTAEATRKVAAESTFDLRRAKLPGTKGPTLGEVAKKYTGIDVGKPLSPIERQREKEKEQKERREDIARQQFEKDKGDLKIAIDSNDHKTIEVILKGGTDTAGNIRAGISDKKIKDLDEALLKNPLVAQNLKKSQVDAISKADDIEQSLKQAVLEARLSELKNAVMTGAPGPMNRAAIRGAISKLKLGPSDIAKLDKTFYKDTATGNLRDDFIAVLNPAVLAKMAEEMDTADLRAIKANIMAATAGGGGTNEQKASASWLNDPANPARTLFN